MPRRYWLPIFAVVGLVLAVQVKAQSVGQHPGSRTSAAQSGQKPKADPPPSIPVSIQNDIKSIARALEAANAKENTAAENQRAQQDLKDQDKMAFWAMMMFWVGTAEMIITGLGVWLVYWTLVHTRNAAIAARDAVTKSEEATDVARAIGQAQVRAYLQCEKAKYCIMDGAITVWPIIKNTGQSPAKHIALHGSLKRWEVPRSLVYPFPEGTGTVPPVGAGQIENGMLMFGHHEGCDTIRVYEELDFSMDCFLSWVDVFGKEDAIAFTLVKLDPSILHDGESPYRSGELVARHRTPKTLEELEREEQEERDEATADPEIGALKDKS